MPGDVLVLVLGSGGEFTAPVKVTALKCFFKAKITKEFLKP